MNRSEYMKRLGYRLRRLPKEDFDRAMEYFTEYFEEAGPENEQQAIEDLGAPEAAADQIVRDMAFENAQEPNKSVKRGFSTVWVGILAIFAAPVGLPLAFAIALVLLAFLIAIVAVIFAVFISAFSVAIVSVPSMVIGVILLFTSPANGIATIGMSLIGAGLGIIFILVSIRFCKWFLNAMTKLFGKMAGRGRKHA